MVLSFIFPYFLASHLPFSLKLPPPFRAVWEVKVRRCSGRYWFAPVWVWVRSSATSIHLILFFPFWRSHFDFPFDPFLLSLFLYPKGAEMNLIDFLCWCIWLTGDRSLVCINVVRVPWLLLSFSELITSDWTSHTFSGLFSNFFWYFFLIMKPLFPQIKHRNQRHWHVINIREVFHLFVLGEATGCVSHLTGR